MKHKKTLLTFLMLCGLFILSKPVSAAKVPVIKAGKSTNLKGTIINVKYSGAAVTMANKSATPSIKIGSEIYVPCKTLFADNGIHASYTANGNTVTVKNGKRKVIFYANKKYAKVNGKKMTLKAAPYFVTYKKSNIRDLLVPAKQAAAFLGLKYTYSSRAKLVTLGVRSGIETSATQVSKVAKTRFINKMGPLARANYKRTGILASVTMAQAILESGWGQSTLAENGNNLFGMKISLSGNNWSGSAWDGVNYYAKRTYEYGSRGRYSITAKFRKYSCAEDSIEDHSAYLLGAKNGSRKRYAGLTKTKSYKKQLQIIKKGGYATSGSYVNDLCRVIRTYNLIKWDK